MQKASIARILLWLSVVLSGCAQTAQRNRVFAGQWEITVAETPEVKFTTHLVRKNGRLTGELTDARNPANPKLPITRVEEKGNNVSIYYRSSEGKEQAIDLTKVDADNLKGTMYTFDASAKRLK